MSGSIILWLKSSIMGLVILGAIGSIIAVFLLKILSFLFRPIFNKTIIAHVKYMAMQNWILGGLSAENNTSKIAVYILYHLMTFLIATALFVIAIIIITIRLIFQNAVIFNILNLSLITLTFLCLYFIIIKLLTMSITYKVHVLPILGGKYELNQSDPNANKVEKVNIESKNG